MINRKSFLALIVITIIVVVAAIWVGIKPTVQNQSGVKLFPELLKQINNITEITGTTNDAAFTVQRLNDQWVVKEKSNYPADPIAIRNFLLGAANLKRLQPKTSNPDLYPKIGVQDVTAKDSKSVQYVLKNDSTVIADGLFGKQRPAKADSSRDEFYVRLLGDPQSWLVEGKLKLAKSTDDWLDTSILDVDRSRIRQAVIHHPGGENVVVKREKRSDKDYTLLDVPTDAEVELQFGVNDVATSFASISLDSVEPGSSIEIGDNSGVKAVMETFDGLRVTMRSAKREAAVYASFVASFEPALVVDPKPDKATDTDANKTEETKEPKESKEQASEGPKPVIKTADDVKNEVTRLNKRWSGWVYKLPEFKLKNITKPKAELYTIKKQEDTKKPEQSTGTDPK